MQLFRIGYDLFVFWAINNRDGSGIPLEGKEVHLFVTHPRGREEVDITIDGNVICWEFLGGQQKYLGEYKLTAEVLTSEGKRVIRKDICEAFGLVGKSCCENTEEDEANISEGGELTLSSELDLYRISPIIPQIGENGNWYVDGSDTGYPSRGEAGSAVEIAYVSFSINGLMELTMDYSYSDGLTTPEFSLDDNGYLNLNI